MNTSLVNPRFKLLVICVALVVAMLAVAPAARAEVMPFQTLSYVRDEAPDTWTAVTGQPHAFQFYVFHPNPGAVVTSAQIVVQRDVFDGTWYHEFVDLLPITGIDHYRIETDWSFPPPENVFVWPECTLMPGQYEWYVLVTVDGEVNKMYDTADLTVCPPVTINDGALFTRSTAVTVTYAHRPEEKYFQISDSISLWPDVWQEIPADDHTIDWTLPSGEDRSAMVYMRFADTPGGSVTMWSDAICLDRTGPVTRAPSPTTVSKGHYARLKYGATDVWSRWGTFTIKITRSGGLVKTLKCGIQSLGQSRAPLHVKQFNCTLPRGAYKFSVYAVDLAGNRQAKVASNRLVVN